MKSTESLQSADCVPANGSDSLQVTEGVGGEGWCWMEDEKAGVGGCGGVGGGRGVLGSGTRLQMRRILNESELRDAMLQGSRAYCFGEGYGKERRRGATGYQNWAMIPDL